MLSDQFTDPNAAVSQATKAGTSELEVRMCASATHQRVIEIISLVGQRFSGQLYVSSIGPGEGECPNFSPQSDARQEPGARR